MTTKIKPTARRFFTEAKSSIALPDLIEIQKDSYKWFLREGLSDLFEEISPITDFIGRNLELTLADYYLDEPKFNESESKAKNITYEASLRVKAKLENKKTS